jgi:hypothetical protein
MAGMKIMRKRPVEKTNPILQQGRLIVIPAKAGIQSSVLFHGFPLSRE